MINMKQIVIILILIGILIGAGYFYNQKKNGSVIMCTLEAKLCPDGSYVGRSGPKCEFAPCPVAPTHIDWKTYSNEGVTFQYPDKLLTSYTHEVDWPPKVELIEEPYSCLNAGIETERAGKTEIKIINGHTYCVTTLKEGAAGTTYIQYAYAKAYNDQMIIFTFSLKQPQCMNYNDPDKTECLNEQEKFSVDNFIDEIISTLQINR